MFDITLQVKLWHLIGTAITTAVTVIIGTISAVAWFDDRIVTIAPWTRDRSYVYEITGSNAMSIQDIYAVQNRTVAIQEQILSRLDRIEDRLDQ